MRLGFAANRSLYYDNAQNDTCFIVNDYLARNGSATFLRPSKVRSVSGGLIHLLPSEDSPRKIHTWDSNGAQSGLMPSLKGVPGKDFLGSFQAWTTLWLKCFDAQGSYFEEYYLILCSDIFNTFFFPNLVITFLYKPYTNILQKVTFSLSYNVFKQKHDR